MLAPGTTIAGYRVEGVVGQGGMGVVYEATQLSLDRTIALKLLAPELSDDPAFRMRFRREGRTQAGLDHPHIIPVYEAGESPDGLFLAMRLVRGPDLKRLIRRGGLDERRALLILGQVADALDVAHDAGLTHRDIKPQNVLVASRDHAYLADFGLTKGPGADSLTGTGQFVGTLNYTAPELIRGERSSPAGDIYAMGAVLYECLCGQVPFPRDSEAAVVYAHLQEPPPSPSAALPGLPPALDAVVMRAMSKDPADRQPTAGALAAEAASALELPAVEVRGDPPPRPGPDDGTRVAPTRSPGPASPWAGAATAPPEGSGAAALRDATPPGTGDATARRDAVPPGTPGVPARRRVPGRADAPNATLLPAELLARLRRRPGKPDRVALGALQAFRYDGLRVRGMDGVLAVYAVPASSGVATVACSGATAAPADCARAAATLRVLGGRVFPLAPRTPYARRVKTAMGELNRVRERSRDRIRFAPDATIQAEAAEDLAGGYKAARRSLSGLRVSPQEAAAHAAVLAALARARAAHLRLAAAARAQDTAGWAAATGDVGRAEGAVASSLDGLRPLGYRAR